MPAWFAAGRESAVASNDLSIRPVSDRLEPVSSVPAGQGSGPAGERHDLPAREKVGEKDREKVGEKEREQEREKELEQELEQEKERSKAISFDPHPDLADKEGLEPEPEGDDEGQEHRVDNLA